MTNFPAATRKSDFAEDARYLANLPDDDHATQTHTGLG
jgi:hypothetical protein